MTEKLKSILPQERIVTKLIVLTAAVVALAFVFAPNRIPEMMEAAFQRLYPPSECGYGYGYSYGYGYDWGYGCFIRPVEDGWIHIWPEELFGLGSAGIVEARGGNPLNTDLIQFQTGVYLHIGPHLITIQPGTMFYAPEWTDFMQLVGRMIEGDGAVVPGSETLAALEFGLPFLNLSVSPPLQISAWASGIGPAAVTDARAALGSPYEGMLVDIQRRAPGSSFWTMVGQCVITEGRCNFSTSVLSSFAVSNVVYVTPPVGPPGGGTGSIPPSDGTPPDGVPDPSPTVPFGLGVNGEPVVTGSLVRPPGFETVYYIDEFARRHPFLGLETYYAWYGEGAGFEAVIIVDVSTLAAFFPLGAPVVYPPGHMIKTPDSPMVYLTMGDRNIKHILDETVAAGIFGPDWALLVYDISPYELSNYIMLAGSITSPAQVDLDALNAWTDNINSEVRGTAVAY